MQKYLSVVVLLLMMTSCKKWLDVIPDSQVADDELFKTEAGFQESLNGIYTRCVDAGMYGFELTGGFPEVLAQNYTIAQNNNWGYRQASLYNYKDPFFVSTKDGAWRALYNAIANCNLLLEKADKNQTVLSGQSYALIKGEALALRAYLHFDVLRLFGPSFVTEPTAKAIPYVNKYSNKVTTLSTVTEALNNMVADLTSAKELLKTSDPIISAAYKVGYPGDTATRELTSPSIFLQNRRHRMNYYAACGTLARVYLTMDKKDLALANALEVINANKFPWTKTTDFINADPAKKDRILYPELVFGFYIKPLESMYNSRFNAGAVSLYITPGEGNKIYESGSVGAEDLRFKQWFKQVLDISGDRLELQKYLRDGDENLHPFMAPALRLSELYYIAAECAWDADQAKALEYFNTVRFNRGIGTTLSVVSKEQFIQELVKEARKEFYGEGQLFYMYKRLNRNIAGPSGLSIPAGKSIFVLPLPNDEIEYGQR